MKKPFLMGILNVTPDSFYDGGKYAAVDRAVEKALSMMQEGADIVDVGAESTRPNADPVSEQEEINRLSFLLRELHRLSIPFSIDTYKVNVAKLAVDFGAYMINDVSGLQSYKMIDLVKASQVKACVMHMQKNPKNMQDEPFYPNGVISDLLDFFKNRLTLFEKKGINLQQIILDPGIGFGKTVSDNILLLKQLHSFKNLGCDLLVGLSRKSFMGKILQKKAKDLLPATIAMNTIALTGGADIIRVHDVAEHKDLIDVISYQRLIKS